MLSIHTNIAVLDSLTHLKKTSTNLRSSVDSISSGKRINTASDDGAGLSVATRLEADKTSLSQATRNTNDAIGLVQTAEGTLDTLSNMMIRFRELSVQAVNETYTRNDREMMLTEMSDIYVEWRRTSGTAEYNGIPVTASNRTLSFQVGKDGSSENTITLDLNDILISNISSFITVGNTTRTGTAVIPRIARQNLRLIDRALSQIGQMRSTLGSVQNRLETALAQSTDETGTLNVAQGRILDVNYASEAASMTRLQMQRQVGIASLSQAKNIPAGLLSLLD